MIRVLSFILTLWAALAAHGEMFKQVDDQGRVTYSNLPTPGAKKIELPPLPTVPAPAPAPKAASRAPSPAGFPKVDSATQKRRDDSRRRILEEEMRAEEQLLAQARQALVEGEAVRLGNERNYQKYLDRVQGLKDDVSLHEKNIEALRREMANLR